MQGEAVFHEEQKFNQVVLWGIVAAIWLFFSYLFLQQVIFEKPVGKSPSPDWMIIVIWSVVSGLSMLFLKIKMFLTIFQDEIHYRFYPFHLKKRIVKLNDLDGIKILKYSPLIDFGGWGVRYSFSEGYAFSVKGNWGLKLYMKSNYRMLIGTQKKSELYQALMQTKFAPICSFEGKNKQV